jgi:hypothetical protein
MSALSLVGPRMSGQGPRQTFGRSLFRGIRRVSKRRSSPRSMRPQPRSFNNIDQSPLGPFSSSVIAQRSMRLPATIGSGKSTRLYSEPISLSSFERRWG